MFSGEKSPMDNDGSVIYEIYEYGRTRANEIGDNNVFDFSIGSPTMGSGDFVKRSILNILQNPYSKDVQDYNYPAGEPMVRESIAESLNERYNTSAAAENIYITSGALSALSICIRAIAKPEDEFITFAPCAPEYHALVSDTGARLVRMNVKDDTFQINFPKLWGAINSKTKGVIINSPGDPTGMVFSQEAIISLCRILEAMSRQYNHPIYIISDDRYRDLVYEDIKVPYIPNYYANTFVCYSYGIAFSLPGESIGYVLISESMENFKQMCESVCNMAMSIGQVCVSSLLQQLVGRWKGITMDTFFYKRSRDMLYEGLTKAGYKCLKPAGTYYILMKSPEEDAQSFCQRAKSYEILMVPGDVFGCPGYVRLAYSTDSEKIMRSMKAFEALAKEYGLSRS